MARLLTPPLDFGPPWRRVGTHRRFGHELTVFVLDTIPAAYSDAYGSPAGALMKDVGFSWTRLVTGEMQPCWWLSGVDDACVPELQAAVDTALATIAKTRAEAAVRAEERRLADIARTEERAGPIRARLRELVSLHPWQLGRSLTEAAQLAHEDEWTPYGLQAAERWISNAEGSRERAEQRIRSEHPAVWYARAEDPAVRKAVHEGLKILAGYDEDWASIENGIGFSQVTCWAGHALAERDELDRGEASHGAKLVHAHRTQLPPDVVLRALGIEMKPRRARRPAGDLLSAA